MKTPDTSSPLNAKTAISAKKTKSVHAIHGLRKARSKQMNIAAARIPKSGNATAPYLRERVFKSGKLFSMPMP
jgi:hypothetical protein